MHQCDLTLGSTKGDEMQPRTKWVLNVKIYFSSEFNKLPLIWLSEWLVVWLSETTGLRVTRSSLCLIDSWFVLTFVFLWLRPDWSPESGSLGWVTVPHSKGHQPPEQLSDLLNTDHCIDVEQWMLSTTQWRAAWDFFSFGCLVCLDRFCVC